MAQQYVITVSEHITINTAAGPSAMVKMGI